MSGVAPIERFGIAILTGNSGLDETRAHCCARERRWRAIQSCRDWYLSDPQRGFACTVAGHPVTKVQQRAKLDRCIVATGAVRPWSF